MAESQDQFKNIDIEKVAQVIYAVEDFLITLPDCDEVDTILKRVVDIIDYIDIQ